MFHYDIFMENLDEKISQILKNEPSDRHSFFQLKYFVIGKEPTPQSQLWRCIKELKSRKESIDAVRLEIDQTKDNKKLLEIKKQRQSTEIYETDFGREEKKINLRMIDRQIAAYDKTISQLEKKLKSIEEEAEFFTKCFVELEKNEKLLPWDDEKAQVEYWSQKLAQDLNLRMLLRLPLDTELVKTILSMENGTPIKVQTQQMLEKVKEIEGQVMRAKLVSQGVTNLPQLKS